MPPQCVAALTKNRNTHTNIYLHTKSKEERTKNNIRVTGAWIPWINCVR